MPRFSAAKASIARGRKSELKEASFLQQIEIPRHTPLPLQIDGVQPEARTLKRNWSRDAGFYARPQKIPIESSVLRVLESRLAFPSSKFHTRSPWETSKPTRIFHQFTSALSDIQKLPKASKHRRERRQKSGSGLRELNHPAGFPFGGYAFWPRRFGKGVPGAQQAHSQALR